MSRRYSKIKNDIIRAKRDGCINTGIVPRCQYDADNFKRLFNHKWGQNQFFS